MNRFTAGLQVYPALSPDAAGRNLVVWSSEGSFGGDDLGTGVQARLVDAGGPAPGGELQVNEYTTGDQQFPAVAWNAGDDFLVVWESAGSNALDQSGASILARMLTLSLFTNGFESGDLSAWSSAVP